MCFSSYKHRCVSIFICRSLWLLKTTPPPDCQPDCLLNFIQRPYPVLGHYHLYLSRSQSYHTKHTRFTCSANRGKPKSPLGYHGDLQQLQSFRCLLSALFLKMNKYTQQMAKYTQPFRLIESQSDKNWRKKLSLPAIFTSPTSNEPPYLSLLCLEYDSRYYQFGSTCKIYFRPN